MLDDASELARPPYLSRPIEACNSAPGCPGVRFGRGDIILETAPKSEKKVNAKNKIVAEKGGSRTLRGPYGPQTGFEDQRRHRAPSFSSTCSCIVLGAGHWALGLGPLALVLRLWTLGFGRWVGSAILTPMPSATDGLRRWRSAPGIESSETRGNLPRRKNGTRTVPSL